MSVSMEQAMRVRAEEMASGGGTRAAAPVGRPLMKNPVLFGCACCELLFTNRASCDTHAKSIHGGGEARVLFHPQATELELKACLFVNLPWTDKAMLPLTVHSSDMELCYATKRLVLKEVEYEPEWYESEW